MSWNCSIHWSSGSQTCILSFTTFKIFFGKDKYIICLNDLLTNSCIFQVSFQISICIHIWLDLLTIDDHFLISHYKDRYAVIMHVPVLMRFSGEDFKQKYDTISVTCLFSFAITNEILSPDPNLHGLRNKIHSWWKRQYRAGIFDLHSGNLD